MRLVGWVPRTKWPVGWCLLTYRFGSYKKRASPESFLFSVAPASQKRSARRRRNPRRASSGLRLHSKTARTSTGGGCVCFGCFCADEDARSAAETRSAAVCARPGGAFVARRREGEGENALAASRTRTSAPSISPWPMPRDTLRSINRASLPEPRGSSRMPGTSSLPSRISRATARRPTSSNAAPSAPDSAPALFSADTASRSAAARPVRARASRNAARAASLARYGRDALTDASSAEHKPGSDARAASSRATVAARFFATVAVSFFFSISSPAPASPPGPFPGSEAASSLARCAVMPSTAACARTSAFSAAEMRARSSLASNAASAAATAASSGKRVSR